MNDAALREDRTGFAGAVAAVITGWALLGGAVLLLVVAMNVASVIGAIFWAPFPGDFEMTEVGVAVAAFMFLPYCQLSDSNVTADIFTARSGPRAIAWFKFVASVTAFLFALLMLWRMYAGMLDQRDYNYTTAILQFRLWWAFVPILVSLALLAVASLLTLIESGRIAARSGA